MSAGPPPSRYEPISIGDESTVVAEFVRDATRETAYQSEAELERAFIELLQSQAYEHLRISSEDELIANLRGQFEALNSIELSDDVLDKLTTYFDRYFALGSEEEQALYTLIGYLTLLHQSSTLCSEIPSKGIWKGERCQHTQCTHRSR